MKNKKEDDKEKILKLIIANSKDGLTMREMRIILDDILLTEVYIQELLIEQRIKIVKIDGIEIYVFNCH
jgi:hypothetical protein